MARSRKIWGGRKWKCWSLVNTVISHDTDYAHYFIWVLFASLMLRFHMATWDYFKTARLNFVYASS